MLCWVVNLHFLFSFHGTPWFLGWGVCLLFRLSLLLIVLFLLLCVSLLWLLCSWHICLNSCLLEPFPHGVTYRPPFKSRRLECSHPDICIHLLLSEMLQQLLEDRHYLSTDGILLPWHTQCGCVQDYHELDKLLLLVEVLTLQAFQVVFGLGLSQQLGELVTAPGITLSLNRASSISYWHKAWDSFVEGLKQQRTTHTYLLHSWMLNVKFVNFNKY